MEKQEKSASCLERVGPTEGIPDKIATKAVEEQEATDPAVTGPPDRSCSCGEDPTPRQGEIPDDLQEYEVPPDWRPQFVDPAESVQPTELSCTVAGEPGAGAVPVDGMDINAAQEAPPEPSAAGSPVTEASGGQDIQVVAVALDQRESECTAAPSVDASARTAEQIPIVGASIPPTPEPQTREGKTLEVSEHGSPMPSSHYLMHKTIAAFSSAMMNMLSDDYPRFTHVGALQDFLEALHKSCSQPGSNVERAEGDVFWSQVPMEIISEPLALIRRKYSCFAYSELVPDLVEDFAQIETDLLDFNRSQEMFLRWKASAQSFAERLPGLADLSQGVLETQWPNPLPEWLPEEQKGWCKSRGKGLEIISGKIKELTEKAGPWMESILGFEIPTEPKRTEDVASELTNSDPVERTGILKKIGNWNFLQVKTMNEMAEATRNAFYEFLRTDFFEIINFLDEGRRNSQEVKAKLMSANENRVAEIERWFDTYDRIIECMESLLRDFDISPVIAARGEPADFNVHETYMTEKDPELKTGLVYEMVFRGYQLTGSDNQIIQRARVTVVRN